MSLVAHHAEGNTSGNGFTTSAIDTTGAKLIVLNISESGTTANTPSDNKGNTYTQAVSQSFSSVSRTNTLWYCLNAVTGTGHTFTTTGTGNSPSIGIEAFSEQGSALDVTNSSVALDSTSLQPGSITPAQNNETIVAGLTHQATSGTGTIDSSFVLTDTVYVVNITGPDCGLQMAYLEQGTAAAVNPTWSGLGATYQIATIAAFKIVAAATTPPLVPRPSRARLRTTPARTEIGHPPPPTIPSPRSARPKDVTRARFLLPPPKLLLGRPPPLPPGPPRGALPRQVERSVFLLPPARTLRGRTPPPTIPAPRPAPGMVERARFLLPSSRESRGIIPPPIVIPRPALAVVTRAHFLLPRVAFARGRTPPSPLGPGRPAVGLVTRARLGPLPGARLFVGLTPRGTPVIVVVVPVIVVGTTAPPPYVGGTSLRVGVDKGVNLT